MAVSLLSSGESTRRRLDACLRDEYGGGRQCNVPRDGPIDRSLEILLWLVRYVAVHAFVVVEGEGMKTDSEIALAVPHY